MTPKKVGDYGVMNAGSHSACPSCNTDLGYYGDLLTGFECPVCGAAFEMEEEATFWYRCTKEGRS